MPLEAVAWERKFTPNDVEVDRAIACAHVEHVHDVERQYKAAAPSRSEHAGHWPAAATAVAKPKLQQH